MTEDELISITIALLFGGQDTTQHQLASLIMLLAERPDVWDQFSDRELVPAAVDEALHLNPATD